MIFCSSAFRRAVVAAALVVLAAVSAPAVAQGRGVLLPDFTELYDRQSPAVVSIDVTQKVRAPRGMPDLSLIHI